MNQTQLVRSAINIFIVVAVSISLFQQLRNVNTSKPSIPTTTNTTTGQQIPLQMKGPVIQGVRIYATDKFQNQMKEILVRNEYNVDIKPYEFQGNEYWFNMVLNWGHMVLIYVLMGKYKAETNDNTKRKIMIGGAVAVIAWFFISAQLKPQRISLEVQGSILYQKDYINEREMLDILNTYEFQLDDLKQSRNVNPTINPTEVPQDSWATQQHQQNIDSSFQNKMQNEQNIYEEQIF